MPGRAAIVFLALAALRCGGPASAPAPPRLAMPGSFDFGPVRPDASLTRSVRLRNSGGQSLQILDVRSSCGCVVGRPARPTIEPGQGVDLDITLHVSERAGLLRRTVTVTTNEPEQPERTLELTAEVRAEG